MCSLLDDVVVECLETDHTNLEPRHIAYNDLSRRDLRALIFHLLYAAESYDYQESLEAIASNFAHGFNIEIPHTSELFTVVQAIIDKRHELDELYKPLLTNWRFDRISVPTMLILRLAMWELQHSDVDERIIINEAVELAKCFAEADAYRFINGILDKAAKIIRPEATQSSDSTLTPVQAEA